MVAPVFVWSGVIRVGFAARPVLAIDRELLSGAPSTRGTYKGSYPGHKGAEPPQNAKSGAEGRPKAVLWSAGSQSLLTKSS